MENNEKPKRQLTEAQRLAFLKAREKRMVNLEKKRQEELSSSNLEEDQPSTLKTDTKDVIEDANTSISEIIEQPPTKKTRKKYTKKIKPITEEDSGETPKDVETVENQSDDIDAEDDKENNEHSESIIQKELVVDHDLLADRIVERISKLDPPVLKRESATRQRIPKQRLTAPTPPQVNFNWM